MIAKQVAALLCSAVLGVMALPKLLPGEQGPDAVFCDSRWEHIGHELKQYFIDPVGECTEWARQSIRLPFHDCFPDGGCDGSIILTDECTTRQENQQMIPMCEVLLQVSRRYNVGAADLINFAASIANKACPYGPFIPFLTGRRDNPVAPPTGQVPPPTFNARRMIEAFGRRGFTPTDLVALVGAHSAGKNLTGASFDATPGRLDSCEYYTAVLTREAEAVLFSDHSLATFPVTEPYWHVYAHSQELWDREYTQAMWKMITQGNQQSYLSDCSRVVRQIFDENEHH